MTGQLQYPCLMLKGNIIEPMRRNTAIAYCGLCIATYRVAVGGTGQFADSEKNVEPGDLFADLSGLIK